MATPSAPDSLAPFRRRARMRHLMRVLRWVAGILLVLAVLASIALWRTRPVSSPGGVQTRPIGVVASSLLAHADYHRWPGQKSVVVVDFTAALPL